MYILTNPFRLFWILSGCVFAQQCIQPRPDPSSVPAPPLGSDLVNYLRSGIPLACATLTANVSVDVSSFSLGGYNLSRSSLPNTPSEGVLNCANAFILIITECVSAQNYWGGNYSMIG